MKYLIGSSIVLLMFAPAFANAFRANAQTFEENAPIVRGKTGTTEIYDNSNDQASIHSECVWQTPQRKKCVLTIQYK